MDQYGTQTGGIGASVWNNETDQRVIISLDMPGFTIMRHFIGLEGILKMRDDLTAIVNGINEKFN